MLLVAEGLDEGIQPFLRTAGFGADASTRRRSLGPARLVSVAFEQSKQAACSGQYVRQTPRCVPGCYEAHSEKALCRPAGLAAPIYDSDV